MRIVFESLVLLFEHWLDKQKIVRRFTKQIVNVEILEFANNPDLNKNSGSTVRGDR